MNGIKHILIIIALIVASMSCCQADNHDLHAHDAEAGAEICSSHDCSCHACDETACSDVFEMPQELTLAATLAVTPFYSVQLSIFNEAKPVARQTPPTDGGVLATLQIIQLLI